MYMFPRRQCIIYSYSNKKEINVDRSDVQMRFDQLDAVVAFLLNYMLDVLLNRYKTAHSSVLIKAKM